MEKGSASWQAIRNVYINNQVKYMNVTVHECKGDKQQLLKKTDESPWKAIP